MILWYDWWVPNIFHEFCISACLAFLLLWIYLDDCYPSIFVSISRIFSRVYIYTWGRYLNVVCSCYPILAAYKYNKQILLILFWLNVDIIKTVLTEYESLSQSSQLDKNLNNISPEKDIDVINRDSLLIKLDCFSWTRPFDSYV